jgi:hypothetical protein
MASSVGPKLAKPSCEGSNAMMGTREDWHLTVAAIMLVGALMVAGFPGCSQGGEGSVTVPGGKDKLKRPGNLAPFTKPAAKSKPSATIPRKP